MQNRGVTLETTKAYAEAFNRQDISAIEDLLDDENVIFSRQEQNSIVGKDNVMRRIRSVLARAKEHKLDLHLVNAIADMGHSKARPCLISFRNGVPVALCVLACKINGKITSISIILSGGVVASARATEKVPQWKGGKKQADERRQEVLAMSKVYVDLFNRRKLKKLGELFDDTQTVYHRSDQSAAIGRKAILRRIKEMHKRLDGEGKSLKLVNAIIDHDGKTAWPCTLGVLDGQVISVGMISLMAEGGKIAKLMVDLNPVTVTKARPTEPLSGKVEQKVKLEQVLERETSLREMEEKLKTEIDKNGYLPHLLVEQMKVEQQLEQIENLKKKIGSST